MMKNTDLSKEKMLYLPKFFFMECWKLHVMTKIYLIRGHIEVKTKMLLIFSIHFVKC